MLSRGYSRLKQVFATFYKSGTGKEVDNFYHWGGTNALADADNTLKYQWQLGAQKSPTRESTGQAEAWYRLNYAMGTHVGPDSLAISERQYHSTQFVFCVDWEKVPADSQLFSGVNSKDGQILTLSMSGLGGSTGASAAPSAVYITCLYDAIVNLRGAEGVEVMD